MSGGLLARLAQAAALAGLLSACAGGGAPTEPAPPGAAAINPACPDLNRWDARRLYGAWEVELPELGQRGHLLLRQHPEFSASLRGEFDYGGAHSIASGDLEDGELNLDESRDGKSLHAFWTGRLVPAACGREIRGTWQRLAREGVPAAESTFVLRRANSGHGW
ncbi:MAG TPA: hypothetical protein PKA16_07885 [Ottowia sp.]|uniref:hypothetical protein n=1 Tax=Ottowia sp. TaxID=1898956 RepID=UPI002B9E1302|nr:hypothetical protein [Ottowia sp.]HMN21298.1 hypothetical protein [Ottowia sp.]